MSASFIHLISVRYFEKNSLPIKSGCLEFQIPDSLNSGCFSTLLGKNISVCQGISGFTNLDLNVGKV